MTPAARVQAAIELLDAIIAAARDRGPPADRLVSEYFRQRRYAGSKDRRAVRELVYDAIRLCGPVPPSGRAAMVALAGRDPSMQALFDGTPHGPAPLKDSEPVAEIGLAPDWLIQMLAASGIAGEDAAALLGRAPLDLRVNTLKADRDTINLPVPAAPTAAPNGLRLQSSASVDQWEAFRAGLIEVQDTGSQLACLAVGARPGETVIDLCAGAGGKTLALAAAMENQGILLACDTDRGRLSRLTPRAERAGAGVITTRLINPGQELAMLEDFAARADAVLIDAPCSGTGTWRRNPEARWRTTPEQLSSYAQAQARLLAIGAALVRPGGRMIFVTCSLLDQEGTDRIEAFLAGAPEWRGEALDLPLGIPRGHGQRLSPHRDGTDGFFIARLSRAC